jgi:gas vesicle protein
MPANSRKGTALGLLSSGNRWVIMLVGLLVGAGVGAVLFGTSQLHGAGLYILVGAAAGAVAGLLFRVYYGNIGLDEVKITIPQLSELHFTVSPDNRLVAWRLYIETATRVSTQPLEAGTGNLREAMNSLYSLFQAVRDSLKETRPSRPAAAGPKVEELGVAMLNLELRPFLSRWHPLLAEWEHHHPDEPERLWEGEQECRAELAALQQRLGGYAGGFATLAGLDSIEGWTSTPS